MTGGNDGGQRALAGFLYQAIAVGGLMARAWLRDGAPAPEQLGVLLELVRQGDLRQETYGQDAELTGIGWDGKHERKLIQFKYSAQPLTHKLEPKELLDIVAALRASAKEANRASQLSTGYVLVSNRRLSREAEACMQAALNKTSHQALGGPNQKKTERAVLRQLVLLEADEAQWVEAISEYGKRLGLTETEFREGMKRLIGRLMQEATSTLHPAFSREDLATELAGFASPREMGRSQLKELLAASLDDFKNRVKVVPSDQGGAETSRGDPAAVLRRAVVEELNLEDMGQHALVLVYGEGGCGKSTLLCTVLEDALQLHSPTPRRYAIAASAARLPAMVISETVATWRRAPAGHYGEHQGIALERLERAHSSSVRPILVLALDGLDEALNTGPESQDAVRRVLALVSEEYRMASQGPTSPRVVVFVTCRTREDLQLIWDLGQPDFGIGGEARKEIPLGDFTPEELVELAEKSTSRAVAERIIGVMHQELTPPDVAWSRMSMSAARSIGAGSKLAKADEGICEALRHPLLWHFFAGLGESAQQRMLSCDPDVLRQVCRGYLQWFCDKANRRRCPHFKEANARYMLARIARKFGDAGRVARYNADWTRPATRDGRFGENDACHLFREASSFGIVKLVEAGTWRWRHPFLCEYLAAQEEGL
jgi:hypothetical protein